MTLSDEGTTVRAFDRFVDVRTLSHLQAAQRIAGDEVQILVDLTGYTRNARTRILAPCPAPIQVNYLGIRGRWADCSSTISWWTTI